jgi:hypothetical protein
MYQLGLPCFVMVYSSLGDLPAGRLLLGSNSIAPPGGADGPE